jgi:hypothetical protein
MRIFKFFKNIFKNKSSNDFSELNNQIFKNDKIEDFSAGEKEVYDIFKHNISRQTSKILFKGALLRWRLAMIGDKKFSEESLKCYLLSDLNCHSYVNDTVVIRFYNYLTMIHIASFMGKSTHNVKFIGDKKDGHYIVVNN